MNEERVVLGRIEGLFGVKGWVKVFSYTEPRHNIAAYTQWDLQHDAGRMSATVEACEARGKGIVAKLLGVDDRDVAALWVGAEISVLRETLPEPEPGRYYWADLEQLEVRTVSGVSLGRVHHLLATGANDVLVVRGERERLIPFVEGQAVKKVDLDQGVITVDWDPEF